MVGPSPNSSGHRNITICFVLQALSSGTLRYTRDIVDGLSRLGVRTVVDSFDSDYRLQGAHASYILGTRFERLGQKLQGRVVLEFLRIPVVLPRLIRVVVGESVDVLYAQNMDESALITCMAGAMTHRPVILFVHDLTDRELYVYERGFPGALIPFLRALAIVRHAIVSKFSPQIFVASRFVEREIRPNARKPIAVIPHGVVPRFRPSHPRSSSDSVRLLCVGKLEKKKRFEVPIEALSLLRDTNAELTIVGSGPRRPILLDLAQRLAVTDRVNLTGFLDDDAIADVLRDSDVGVVSSLWEGFGYAALEMMASGLPVLASNTGALPEIVVDGSNGFVFGLDDFKQLAGIIRRVCADRSELERLGRGAVETALKYNLDRMIAETYSNVCLVLQRYSSNRRR